ncbi:unnamed protein product, partial [Strongylus vulgaris]
ISFQFSQCEARTVPNPDFPPECRVGEANLYDPSLSMEVPWFNVDLDAPAKERFKHVVRPFKNEIQAVFDVLGGIADELGCNLGQLAFLNIFYELSRFCTSIVAQPTGNKDMWHARGGEIPGMKPNGFSLSMNAKVQPDIKNIIAWLNGDRPDIEFAMYFDRKVFEEANTFDEARQLIYKVPMLSGAYFILGGNKPGQGSVIVRNTTDVQFERKLFDGDNDWFVLQTNYDPDKLLLEISLTPAWIFQVLKSRPLLNKTTVHTVIMSVTKDVYQTFIQSCPNPCWAF